MPVRSARSEGRRRRRLDGGEGGQRGGEAPGSRPSSGEGGDRGGEGEGRCAAATLQAAFAANAQSASKSEAEVLANGVGQPGGRRRRRQPAQSPRLRQGAVAAAAEAVAAEATEAEDRRRRRRGGARRRRPARLKEANGGGGGEGRGGHARTAGLGAEEGGRGARGGGGEGDRPSDSLVVRLDAAEEGAILTGAAAELEATRTSRNEALAQEFARSLWRRRRGGGQAPKTLGYWLALPDRARRGTSGSRAGLRPSRRRRAEAASSNAAEAAAAASAKEAPRARRR